jgi:predicted 3-demethylubiquinone-9 3-methyltransferase (glyoxalase superfamily)
VSKVTKITPFLWFDTQAQEAAEFYTSIFERSRIMDVTHNGDGGPGAPGSVMTVSFEVDGQRILAFNGGPQHFKFNESISFVVNCTSQAEVDHFWDRLSAGGEGGQCGWLKDKYGLSWQIVPDRLPELLTDPDPEKAQRALQAMFQMQKIDIAAIERAVATAPADS